MEQVSYLDFVSEIAKDNAVKLEKEVTLSLPADRFTIRSFVARRAHNVRVFDGEIEHPYMLTQNQRNEDSLKKGVELRVLATKNLNEVLKEAKITLQSERCEVCEGGGWYSEGSRYFYKNIYTEF